MSGSLNTAVALRIGPLLLDTLFKHYLERKTVTKDSKAREELLYDAAFTAFRAFMDAATKHSVEELQQFSNVRIPAPPWVHCVRLRIPLSSCNDAAGYLIRAFGGEAQAREFVGGVKWWQARGVQGVDAQWVCSKKDLEREERAWREGRKETMGAGGGSGSGSGSGSGGPGVNGEETDGVEEPAYSSGMDNMRCLLYLHGGGYYFGSIDQERYTMQRYARKMKGRCFAVDYRLAPQYPFPCALQDCIAAYLYLIRPPPGVSHAPIPPARIVLGGDSAGGGLVLSLLQIIRDTGLPMPGGAVLISPWCDLTHSFPSIFENTATDIVPAYGLSIHKPSTLWPPPPEDLSTRVRSRLRQRIMSVVHPHPVHAPSSSAASTRSRRSSRASSPTTPTTRTHFTKNEEGQHLHHANQRQSSDLTVRGDTRLPPRPGEEDEFVPLASHDPLSNPHPLSGSPPEAGREEPPGKSLATVEPSRPGPIRLTIDGQDVVIRSQVQLYCTNHQLTHPLISPALGYLGGLCPLLVIASDKEVLRDEIIYVAHKAARPDRYPLKDDTRAIYPHLAGIEARHAAPTPVHLQVYDDTSHVLPLISFSTPAKYCYRAIAAFCVHVTPTGSSPNGSTSLPGASNSSGSGSGFTSEPPTPSLSGDPSLSPRKSKTQTPTQGRTGMHISIDGLPRILPDSPLATTPEEENSEWISDEEEKRVRARAGRGAEEGEGSASTLRPEPKGRQETTGLPHTAGPLASQPAALAEAANATAAAAARTASSSAAAHDGPSSRKSPFARLTKPASPKVRGDGRAFSFPSHLLRSMSVSSKQKQSQSRDDTERPEAGPSHGHGHGAGPGRRNKPESKQATEDVAGPRFGAVTDDHVGRKAGDPVIYSPSMKGALDDGMIRERVSRTGTIRPLEPPAELAALNLPLAEIGVIKENAAKRYLHGQALWDKKFASTVRQVEKDRLKHLKRARKDADRKASMFATGRVARRDVKDEDASWGWGWAIEGEEPPPSSIVARRDTHEARRLARIADKSWEEDTEDDKWAGNRLWSQLADWLTGPGEKDTAGTNGPFDEGESNAAMQDLRRRGTIASTDGRERWPNELVEPPSSEHEEPKVTVQHRKSSLNPFRHLRHTLGGDGSS